MERQKVKDLQIEYCCGIRPDMSLEKAWDRMVEKNIKTLPVVDEEGNMQGLISMRDITLAYINDAVSKELERRSIPLRNILDTVEGTVLLNARESVSLEQIVFTADEQWDAPEGATVIRSRFSEKTIYRILIRSFPVEMWMKTENLYTVYLEEDICEACERAVKVNYRYYPVLNKGQKVIGMVALHTLYQQMKLKNL